MNRMTIVYLAGAAASLAILASGLTALFTLSWFKGRGGPRHRKRVKKAVEEPVEQLA